MHGGGGDKPVIVTVMRNFVGMKKGRENESKIGRKGAAPNLT